MGGCVTPDNSPMTEKEAIVRRAKGRDDISSYTL
jgi:hypothetical protein